MDTGDVMDSDDADWYREEVGEEPDPGKTWRLTLKNRMQFERIASFRPPLHGKRMILAQPGSSSFHVNRALYSVHIYTPF